MGSSGVRAYALHDVVETSLSRQPSRVQGCFGDLEHFVFQVFSATIYHVLLIASKLADCIISSIEDVDLHAQRTFSTVSSRKAEQKGALICVAFLGLVSLARDPQLSLVGTATPPLRVLGQTTLSVGFLFDPFFVGFRTYSLRR